MMEPSNYLWFHGRINRQEAEELLERAGKRDGMFLLRESTAQTGSYALSMCHNRKVIHYHIQRHSDGKVAIEDGPKFEGPVDLIQYHHHTLDGLLAKLTTPCNRLPGVEPKKYSGANQSHIQDAACAALASMGLVENEAAATLMRTKIESAIGSVMHKNQAWYHGTISRDEAERRINALGCQDGMYLIRERRDPAGSFALGLAFQGGVVHYLFDADTAGRLSIKAGPKFDNLMLAVDHYSNREDGLLCRLGEVCNVEMFEGRKRTPSQGSTSPRQLVSNGDQFVQNPFLNSGKAMVPDLIAGVIKPSATALPSVRSKRLSGPPPLPATGPPSSTTNRLSGPPPLPVRPNSGFSLPMNPKSPPPTSKPGPSGFDAHAGAGRGGNSESIYDSIKMKKSSSYYNQFKDSPTHRLKKENLTLDKELGHGNFGSVLRGEYRKGNGDSLAVAVKKLKAEEASNPNSEIMHEAEVMMKLDHPNIVRIIGMCQDGSMMLVMELAPEGPLHKYLKKNKSLPMLDVLTLMLQVAEGMKYLESKQFVHRDLAARNVLVVNESFVKISDFGMSRAMGTGSDYYRAGKAGKWPLKWYAPECIYYRKFSSKSDVWSYGVTLWEATSYGTKPYQGLSGQVILEKIESGYRLPNPEGVPPVVYRIMKHCWEYLEENRPNFARIFEALCDIILNMRQRK